LLDRDRVGVGEPLPDPAAFSKRLSDVMRRPSRKPLAIDFCRHVAPAAGDKADFYRDW
jgi:hypothetical protein